LPKYKIHFIFGPGGIPVPKYKIQFIFGRATPGDREGDIKKFFDNIDHTVLANLLKKYFDDADLIDLYWKLVKAGYLAWDPIKKTRNFVLDDVGVPQGGILSPLLSNVILHELDSFVGDLITKQNKVVENISPSIPDKEYNRLSRQISKTKKLIRDSKEGISSPYVKT
jgi:retron-type reverse transcriptase